MTKILIDRNDVNVLTGRKNGEADYYKYIRIVDIDYNDKIIIVFPSTIEKVGISYTKALFKDFIEKFGTDVFEHITIEAKECVIEKIKKDVAF